MRRDLSSPPHPKPMKIFHILTLCLLWTVNVQAQDTPKEQSQAEEFSSQAGTLMQKEFLPVGEVKGLKVKVMKMTDLLTKKSVNALRFEYEYKSSIGADTKIAVIDKDEVAALETSLTMMKANVMTTTMPNYTEVTFSSRSGFQAGCFNEAGKAEWSPYVKVEKFDGKSYVFLKAEDIETLLQLVQAAKAQL
jgi:hypothetical protein